MITIYKNAYHVGWDTEGVGLLRQSSTGGGGVSSADLTNYYTIEQLNNPGLSIVDFQNIANAYHNDLLGLEGGAIADNSSGESSGYAGEYYHLDFYNWDRLMYLNFSMSLVEDASNIVTLVNDETSPGILKVYGTDVSGIKGWYDIIEASSGTIVVDQYWQADSIGDLSPVLNGAGIEVDGITIKNNIIKSNTALYLIGSDEVSSPYAYAGPVYISSGAGAISSRNLYFGSSSFDLTTFSIGTAGIESDVNLLVITKGYGTITLQGGTGGIEVGGTDVSNNYVQIVNGLQPADSSLTQVVMYDPITARLYNGDGVGVSLSGSTDNTICTVTGANAIQGEANLTYDGTDLTNSAGDMYANDFILNSDRRLKTKIKSYKSEELIIDYKQFELKSDIGQQRWGVVAQEIQKLYPELVRENKDGHLSVSYIDLLVREIVNLKDRVKELENR